MVTAPSHRAFAEEAILVVAAVVALMGAYDTPLSTNVLSRLATVESLVHRGTFTIDDSPFDTIDKVQLDGHFYSTKPPLFPTLMAGQYWLVRQLTGWDITRQPDQRRVLKLLVCTWQVVPYVLLLAALAGTLRWHVADAGARALALAACAWASPLAGFALTINNHLPAAACMMGAVYFALGLAHGHLPATPARFVLAGALCALLPTFDLPGMFFSPLCFLYLARIYPRQTFTWYVGGAVIVLAAHFGLNLLATGSFLPLYLRRELYFYPGSYWNAPRAFDALSEPKGTYLFHLVLGRKGLLLLFPVLWLAVWAVFRAARDKQNGCAALRTEIATYAALVVGWIAFYTVTTNNYGGGAFGVRWFIFFLPPLYFMTGLGLEQVKTPRARWVALILLGVSLYSGLECFYRPWVGGEEWPRVLLGPILSH